MKSLGILIIGASALLMFGPVSRAGIRVSAERNQDDSATGGFRFKNVPPPSRNDAATQARFVIVDGRRDPNGGSVDALHDGKLPFEEDEPPANFFFSAGADGGRLLVDLGSAVEITQVNTYSWHPGSRGPQVYQLYASDAKAAGFLAEPKRATDPEQCGWTRIAKVDTRPPGGEGGGQHGVCIASAAGAIGAYRYLLFDVSRTEDADAFGNTFYSEIDVVAAGGPAPAPVETPPASVAREIVEAEGGKYQLTIDTSQTPDLTEWARKELAPVVQAWYPQIVKLLSSEGYEAPRKVSIIFSQEMRGVAATSGTRIRCSASWYRQNLQGEAKGSIVHELAHVVQDYGRGRRANPNATRAPGWLVEGIADYIRWFKYEPESHGAEITRRNIARARYDGNYRISANFLNWVIGKYDQHLVERLNAAIRQGNYSEDLWKQRTGRTVQELGDEWRKGLEEGLAAQSAADAESKAKTP